MKNSLDAAMQGIEGLINSDGSGTDLKSCRYKTWRIRWTSLWDNTEPSLSNEEGVTTRRKP